MGSVLKSSVKMRFHLCLLKQCSRVKRYLCVNSIRFIGFEGIHSRKPFYTLKQLFSLSGDNVYTTPFLSCNQKSGFSSSPSLSKQSNSENETDEEEDKNYEELVKQTLKLPDEGHNVLVIQPYIKWGSLKRRNTTPELQLDEAIALVNTLPGWTVADSTSVPLRSFRSPRVFGKGSLSDLSKSVSSNKDITAVFVSINTLSPAQHEELEEVFKVPVFDRYTIVVQIFKLHAVTEEAKLQVAMGEIPYLWKRLRYDREDASDKMGGGATVGGPGESYMEIKRRLLQDRERRLKQRLKRLCARRDLLRNKRERLEMPTVAVVGYTNAGKTALIKALTGEEEMQPRDALFATLDVTVHAGRLPSGLKVLFVDTVGFLSDVPTELIQSFVTTLEDALRADLIIHVRDASHPDLVAQHAHVAETLRQFHLPERLTRNIITVSNKIDLLHGTDFAQSLTNKTYPPDGTDSPQSFPASANKIDPANGTDFPDSFPISAKTGTGMQRLKFEIEKRIIEATGQIFIKIRVPNGGPELVWLHKESTVVKVVADETDYQFTFVNTIISEANLNRFKHKFITSLVRK